MAEEFYLNFDPHVGDILTKNDILSKFSEEQIFAYYGCPIQKGLFRSPLRKDSNPTVSIYRSKRSGKLFYKDFGCSEHSGDVFWFVSTLLNISYQKTLVTIANDFGLIKNPTMAKNKPVIEYKGEKVEETSTSTIQCEIKAFTEQELKWWRSFGISQETLNFYKVFSIKNIFLNGNIFLLDNQRKKVFGYYGGTVEGKEYWKIYFPTDGKKSKYKFIGNYPGTKLQGAKQLPKEGGKILVITKSLKDCMLLHELGIPAIAPASETTFLTDAQYEKVKSKFDKIFLLYDNDYTGITFMNKIRKSHKDVIPIWLPRSKAKDISDFYKAYGKEETEKLIKQARDYYGCS